MLCRALVVATALVAFAAACARGRRPLGRAKEQVEFGIKVAQNGLWKEALYRWEKAVADRSDLRGRVEQPGDRATSTQGNFDEAREGVREGRRARPEEPADPAELRSLQRNQ